MAVNPNFTNANANTIFPALGGGGNSSVFPEGLQISIGETARYLQINPLTLWGQPALSVENTSNTSNAIPQPLVANPFFAFGYDGSNATSQKSGSYGANLIKFQGSNGSGNTTDFLRVNDIRLGDPFNAAFALNGVSSIQVSSITANAVNLFSSLRGTFPTSFI